MLTHFLVAAAIAQPSDIVVPFHLTEEAIIVDAKINGRQTSLMFDSGFSGEVVLGEHINVGPATGSMPLRDFVGTFEAKTVDLKSLQVGEKSLKLDNAQIVQMGSDYSQSYGIRCDGILGLGAFAGNVVEINFEKKQFIFHPNSFDIRTKTPDNKKTFLAKMLPTGNNSIELRVEAANGERMNLALDTGNAFYATTHKDVLERIGLWKVGTPAKFQGLSGVASGTVASWNIRLTDMKIFGVPTPDSIWNIIDLPSSSAEGDGTVGFQFLKNFNMVIDLERRHVWLDNFSGTTKPEHPAELGIFAFWDTISKRVIIYNVVPGSPAADAGIKRGDHLLGLNNQDLSTLGWRQINNMLRGEEGSEVRLDISRGGNYQKYTLTRKLLVNTPM